MKKDHYDIDGNPTTLEKLVRTEPEWAANRIRQMRAERGATLSLLKEIRQSLDTVSAAQLGDDLYRELCSTIDYLEKSSGNITHGQNIDPAAKSDEA